MIYGLEEKLIHNIKDVFKQYPAVEQVKVFGSRALGTFRSNSDIDLALFGDLTLTTLANIHADLEALPTPYKFDIVAYKLVEHPALIEHINKVAKSL